MNNDLSEREQFEGRKDQARALWRAGDPAGYVRTVQASAADGLAASLDEAHGAKVLDAVCGTGASAFPLARRGFEDRSDDPNRTKVDNEVSRVTAACKTIDQ